MNATVNLIYEQWAGPPMVAYIDILQCSPLQCDMCLKQSGSKLRRCCALLVITEACCRDVDSWAEFAESTAKGQDRKFSRGGFSEDLTSLSGLGDSSAFNSDRNKSPAGDRPGKQHSCPIRNHYARTPLVLLRRQ